MPRNYQFRQFFILSHLIPFSILEISLPPPWNGTGKPSAPLLIVRFDQLYPHNGLTLVAQFVKTSNGGWDPPRDETKETRLIEMGKHFHAWRMIQHWSFQCFNFNPKFYDRYPLISILSSSGGESYWVFTIMKTENGWTMLNRVFCPQQDYTWQNYLLQWCWGCPRTAKQFACLGSCAHVVGCCWWNKILLVTVALWEMFRHSNRRRSEQNKLPSHQRTKTPNREGHFPLKFVISRGSLPRPLSIGWWFSGSMLALGSDLQGKS